MSPATPHRVIKLSALLSACRHPISFNTRYHCNQSVAIHVECYGKQKAFGSRIGSILELPKIFTQVASPRTNEAWQMTMNA